MADLTLRDQLQTTLGTSFTIERELGGGGMSRVFVAEEMRFGRKVVIKVLMPELVQGMSAERFEREIKLAAQLQQANIVSVIGAGESEGLPYYTMPYVDGESLRGRLGRGPLRITETISILRDVTRALVYAHAKGVVHRDIKPENILLAGGVAVVTDFGIAKALSASKTDAPGGTLTVVGTSLGTPAYMAPEQAVGDKVDERADLYALGVVAYEMLSGSHPFSGKTTAQQFITAHLAEKPADIAEMRADTPPMLADLVMQCLAKEPVNRPESAVEILRMLEDPALSTGTGIHKRTTGTARAPAGGVSSGARKWIAGGLAVAVLAALAFSMRDRIGAVRAGADSSTSRPNVTGSINTIAVIPFTNTGGKTEDEYFSDGMTDELAHALSRVPLVQVAGRTSSYSFKGKQASAREIGKALNVAAVVEGSVRRAGDRLRVIAQLTNVSNGLVLWSDTYESRIQDVFEVQDQFTKAIVSAIAPTLRGGVASAASIGSRGTRDLAAYEDYLKGKHFLFKRGEKNVRLAMNWFASASSRDTTFTRAYAGFAQACAILANYGVGGADSLRNLAEVNADRAISLDPHNSDAHAALASIATDRRNFSLADRHFQHALESDPNNYVVYVWRALSYKARGWTQKSIKDFEHAARLEPLSTVPLGNLAREYVEARNFREARLQTDKLLQLDSSTYAYWGMLSTEYIYLGFPDSAIDAARRAALLSQGRGSLIQAFVAAGRWREVDSLRALVPSSERAALGDDRTYLLVTGQHARILDLWEKQPTFTLFAPCLPIYDRIKREPRFIALAAKGGVPVCPQTSPWPFPKRNDGKK